MITKAELSELLHSLNIPVGEGEQFLLEKGNYPKVTYWEILWTDVMASGDDYEEIVTYQVSFASQSPRDKKLRELKRLLNERGLHPTISHEPVTEPTGAKYRHSYFSIDVVEAIT